MSAQLITPSKKLLMLLTRFVFLVSIRMLKVLVMKDVLPILLLIQPINYVSNLLKLLLALHLKSKISSTKLV